MSGIKGRLACVSDFIIDGNKSKDLVINELLK